MHAAGRWLAVNHYTAVSSMIQPCAPPPPGNETLVGQYESMSTFGMPQLFRVVEGIDIYDTKVWFFWYFGSRNHPLLNCISSVLNAIQLITTLKKPNHRPQFNIVSPGADADIYFPFSDHERRLTSLHADLKVLAPSILDCHLLFTSCLFAALYEKAVC
jgi:hypothetical protein